MDCKHVDALLMDYLYQELDPGQAEHVEAHLQTCARCAGELSAYERTRATMRDLPELEPPSSMDAMLLAEAAKAVRLQPEPAPSFWARVRESMRLLVLNPAMTAAVTLVVVLGVSFVIYRNSPPPKSGPTYETPAPPMAAAPEEDRRAAGTATAVAQAKEAAKNEQPPAGAAGEDRADSDQRTGYRLRRQLARDEAQAAQAPQATPGWGKGGLTTGKLASSGAPKKKMARSARHADKELAGADMTAAPNRAPVRESKSASYADADDAKVDSLLDGKAGGGGGKGDKLRPKARKAPAAVAAAEPTKSAPTPAGPPAVKPKAEPRPTTIAKSGAAKSGELGKAQGGAGSGDLPLQSNVTINKKSPQRRGKGSSLAGLSKDEQTQAAEERPVYKGKGKYGQSAGVKQTSEKAVLASADHWVKQGLSAQKRNDCSHALAYYEHALALDPKLEGKLASLVRSCATTLNEKALAEARKANRRISGYLNVEVARRAKMRQQKAVDLEAEDTGGKTVGRTRAKAAAKPAKSAPSNAAH
jgi:hypothetical protein